MDEKLEQVLYKVELLCEQNPEFAAAMRAFLKVEPAVVAMATASAGECTERVDKIEQYLGLDYKLDTVTPDGTKYKNLDYSFVTDEALREQLESDFREMMRYRFGCRSHEANFDEFCRFAHLQLESLVNDCMEMWSLDENNTPDINIAKENIQNNWPPELELNISTKATSIDGLDYYQKSTAILRYLKVEKTVISRVPYTSIYFPGKNIFAVNYFGDVINHIRRIRNESSHRGVPQMKEMDSVIENYEHQKKVKTDPQYGYQYEFQKYDKDAKYYMWCKRQSWDDVIKTILLMIDADKKMYDQTAK